jgi:ubiquinone/menaquinone biosynthesis C-methylase UbiE
MAQTVGVRLVKRADTPGTVTAVADRGWQSYDQVVDAYDNVWHRNFEPAARDLVALAGISNLPAGSAVLDVGTGTGVVAAEAARRAAPGVIVGLDPSVPMLVRGRAHTGFAPVAAVAPGLPFRDSTFDGVVANVVLSHFEDYDSSLTDMVRVLRPGRTLGLTAWGALDDEPVDDGQQRELNSIWKSTAARFVDIDVATDVIDAAIPWEGWFSDPAHFRGALEANGLRRVELHGRTYRHEVTQRVMLDGYETSFWGRHLRQALGDADWHRFRHEVAGAAHAALPDPITRVDQLLIAVATKRHETSS